MSKFNLNLVGAQELRSDVSPFAFFRGKARSGEGHLFKQSLDAIEDLIFIKDPNSRLIWGNKGMRKFYGMTEAQLAGIIDAPFVETEITSQYVADDRLVVASKKVLEIPDEPITRHDGVTRRFHTTKSPILDEDDNVIMIVGISRDITDQLRITKERDELLLSERKSREEAERASRSKDAFLAILSHELRTPLTTILGWAQELHSPQLDRKAIEEGLDIIERSATVQGKLIDDLLEVSRIQSGKIYLDIKVVELAQILAVAVASVRNMADQKQIQISVTLPSSPCRIAADSNRIQQVLWNLLTNAIKFTPNGGKIFVVLRAIESRSERQCQIQVSDTGIGIKPEFAEHIFDRFTQADTSMTRNHGGLGLGLAIVKSLVEMQNGNVQVYSEGENLGAQFTVNFPMETAKESTLRDSTAPMEIDCEAARLDGMRVLVVDDSIENLYLFSFMLGALGAEVQICTSAVHAVETWHSFQPHVLLSDLSMPEEDGYSLIKKVKALDEKHGRSTPVIAVTAFAGMEEQRRAIDAGFAAHLAKPVRKSALSQVIARVTAN